jgi:flagellar hook-basal body complex protein FliE
MTSINSVSAGINAYRDIAGTNRATNGTGAAGSAAGAGKADGFTSELKNVAESWIDTLRKGEQQSTQAVAGQVDIRDVVMAVNNAEVTLQTAVAVRDKVIAAYQEIMRMPI